MLRIQKVSGSLNYDSPLGTTGSFSYDGKELSLKIEKKVFNNVSTAYTWTDFKTYITSFSGTIMLTGALYDVTNNKYMATTLLRNRDDPAHLYVYGIMEDGTLISSATYDLYDKECTINDAVNKIN